MIKIAPSILSADFAHLGHDLDRIVEAGADYIHIDLMDGMFVPNISFGPMVFQALRERTDAVFDVHLMIEQPERYIESVAQAGADIITVHAEATQHLHSVLQQIEASGKKVGVVINPGTPVCMIQDVLYMADLVLVMTVNPGFGGQAFIPSMMKKVEELKHLREKHQYKYEIEVDGGINAETAVLAKEAGADVLVAGSYVYGSSDIKAAIDSLR